TINLSLSLHDALPICIQQARKVQSLFKSQPSRERGPAGVPVSDPFTEVRVLKTWARLGVYSAILVFTPIDLYLVGFTFFQMAFRSEEHTSELQSPDHL